MPRRTALRTPPSMRRNGPERALPRRARASRGSSQPRHPPRELTARSVPGSLGGETPQAPVSKWDAFPEGSLLLQWKQRAYSWLAQIEPEPHHDRGKDGRPYRLPADHVGQHGAPKISGDQHCPEHRGRRDEIENGERELEYRDDVDQLGAHPQSAKT